jgi:mannose-6-phosphate isomerase-like protein (cupin superfamily)
MLIKSLDKCPEIIAGDQTTLRELLHPARDDVALRSSLAHARVQPGVWTLRHALSTVEIYYILRGQGIMEIDGEQREVTTGDAIYIPPHGKQRIFNSGTGILEFLCLVDPAWRAEHETVGE